MFCSRSVRRKWDRAGLSGGRNGGWWGLPPLLHPRHSWARAGKDVAAIPFMLASQLCKWFPTELHFNWIAPVASVSTDARQIKINNLTACWCTGSRALVSVRTASLRTAESVTRGRPMAVALLTSRASHHRWMCVEMENKGGTNLEKLNGLSSWCLCLLWGQLHLHGRGCSIPFLHKTSSYILPADLGRTLSSLGQWEAPVKGGAISQQSLKPQETASRKPD